MRISSFAFDPQQSGPHKVVVGLYRNGISTYDEATGALTPATGLPAKVRRITLARAASNPLIMYAGIEQVPTGQDFASVFRSFDGGASWTIINNTPNYCRDQCWYDNTVTVDPTNADVVYLGGSLCSVWKSSNGTTASPTFIAASMPNHVCAADFSNWPLDNLHADIHAIVFDINNPGKFYVAGDGGIAASADGGTTWNKLNNGLESLQFLKVCIDDHDGTVLGGMRDNGTAQIGSGGSLTWNGLLSGDGGGCVGNMADPVPANRFILASAQFGYLWRMDANGKLVFDKSLFDPGTDRAPYINLVRKDPSNPQRIYLGTQRVWRSTGGGAAGTWQAISPDVTAGLGGIACNTGKGDDFLTAIAVAPSASNVIYTASAGGILQVSKDDGATWTNITKAPLPNRWATGLAVDPFNPDIVYATFAGFSQVTPQTPGHLFRSMDGGATWAQVDTAINSFDTPFESIVVLPIAPSILFIGTEFGVLVSIDAGASWHRLGGHDLPNVPVYDLGFDLHNLRLIAATHGRGMWSFGLTN
jgi:photosystem II stability/assembly factor-like uncharacterized protein